eukprot:3279318-Lingulodinium_polyedra.AAC.1
MQDVLEGRLWEEEAEHEDDQGFEKARKKKDKALTELLAKYPGLTHLANKDEEEEDAPVESNDFPDPEPAEEVVFTPENEDEVLEELFDRVEMDAQAWDNEAAFKLKDFRAKQRGSKKKLAAGEDPFDCWQGMVLRQGEAQQWCIDVGLQQTM